MTPWPISRAVAIRLVWTCLTALGSPVEPDVYIQNATSSDRVGATNGCGLPSASTSSNASTSRSRSAAACSGPGPTTTIARKCGRRSRIDSKVGSIAPETTTAAARLSANR